MRGLRELVGNKLILSPGVTAVIRHDEKFLVARQRDSGLWSLVGGAVEPLEEPKDAVAREVIEELGVTPSVGRIIGAYGGPDLATTYPNGDEVSYVTIAYECELPGADSQLEDDELLEVAWHSPETMKSLPRHPWIDRVLADAARMD